MASTDIAILDAASDLMAQRGYRGMTVGAVATMAGVSEPTVYLRFPTKYDLAVAAIARRPLLTTPPDTGDVAGDLVALLTDLVSTASAIGLSIVGVVLAEEPEHPEFLAQWRTTVGAAAATITAEILERGRRRGQVRNELEAGLVSDLLIGAYLAHYTHVGPPDPEWPRQIVAFLLPGIM